jgi:hypothetical protein
MNTVSHILSETMKPYLRRVSSKLPEMAHRVLSLLAFLTLLFNPLLTAAAAAATADPPPAALAPDVESPADLSAPAESLPHFYRPPLLPISEFGAPTLAEQPASRLPPAESGDASTLAKQSTSLQSVYSEALGNDDATYHVVTDGQGGWQAATPEQGLSSAFTAAGVVVLAGDDDEDGKPAGAHIVLQVPSAPAGVWTIVQWQDSAGGMTLRAGRARSMRAIRKCGGLPRTFLVRDHSAGWSTRVQEETSCWPQATRFISLTR